MDDDSDSDDDNDDFFATPSKIRERRAKRDAAAKVSALFIHNFIMFGPTELVI